LPLGPIPVEEAIKRCHELRGHLDGDEAAEAAFFESLAQLEAMSGRFEEARRSIVVSIENRDRLGLHFLTTKYALPVHGMIELLAGEPAAAESPLRRACEEAMQSGDREVSSNAASLLIEAQLVQDRPTDVEPLLEIAEYATAGDAVGPHVRSLSARAGVLIGRGDYLSAVEAARKAVGLVLETDDINLQATAQLRYAEALSAANRVQEAMKAAERAVQLFERKGNIVSAEGARRYLSGLAPARLSE
jgi:tetratricopeptide (TPR) repeat protein